MKLNRRGYLTVEVILASVVAVAIALFLMEITIKLVNITDDAYVDTELLTDRVLIIKNIKEKLEDDIENGNGINSIQILNSGRQSKLTISFCNNNYVRNIYVSNNKFIYDDSNNVEIYSKDLNSKYLNNYGVFSNKTGTINNNEYVLFKLTANNKFSKENFEADIIVYNNKAC